MKATATNPLPLQLATAMRSLWRWWSGEIAALLPPALKHWLAGRQGGLLLALDGERATLFQATAGQRRRLASFDLAGPLPSAVAAVAGDDLTLELPAGAALRRGLALPAAAEGNLAEVVSFELERHTPFRRAETYHGFRIIDRDAARQRLAIELTVAPRATIDEALARLRRIGLDVGTVQVAAERGGAEPSPDLLPARAAARAPRLPRLALAGLAAAAGMLGIAAIAIPVLRAHEAAARLEAALLVAKREAAESARLQKAIDAALGDRGFLTARKRRVVPVSVLLDTLTRLLPDDTWLTELRIAGSDLELAGSGASASAVVALLDGAPGLSDAAFRSPVTQDEHQREQFDIGARLGAASGSR